MKNFFVALFSLAIVCFLSTGCVRIIPTAALPQPAQSFIQTHFSAIPVSFAKSEVCEYEVVLSDGSELEFKKNGEWKSIDMNHSAVPASVLATLPPTVLSYAESRCPGVPVEKIKRGFWYGYKLELVNDIELVFNTKGTTCKRIDD